MTFYRDKIIKIVFLMVKKLQIDRLHAYISVKVTLCRQKYLTNGLSTIYETKFPRHDKFANFWRSRKYYVRENFMFYSTCPCPLKPSITWVWFLHGLACLLEGSGFFLVLQIFWNDCPWPSNCQSPGAAAHVHRYWSGFPLGLVHLLEVIPAPVP